MIRFLCFISDYRFTILETKMHICSCGSKVSIRNYWHAAHKKKIGNICNAVSRGVSGGLGGANEARPPPFLEGQLPPPPQNFNKRGKVKREETGKRWKKKVKRGKKAKIVKSLPYLGLPIIWRGKHPLHRRSHPAGMIEINPSQR